MVPWSFKKWYIWNYESVRQLKRTFQNLTKKRSSAQSLHLATNILYSINWQCCSEEKKLFTNQSDTMSQWYSITIYYFSYPTGFSSCKDRKFGILHIIYLFNYLFITDNVSKNAGETDEIYNENKADFEICVYGLLFFYFVAIYYLPILFYYTQLLRYICILFYPYIF